MSNSTNIRECLGEADLVIGAVLIEGAKAPILVSREMLGLMHKGSVIIDVAVDQGGSVETCKPTTHTDPTYMVDGIVHYCVANMPGAVGRTSTYALTNATTPYLILLADRGIEACRTHSELRSGVNVHAGNVTYPAVADSFGYPCAEFS